MVQELISKHDWLSLVSMSGLMISEPVIESEFKDGLTSLAGWKYKKFKKEYIRFEINYKKDKSAATRKWLDFILEDLLDIESFRWKNHAKISHELIINLDEYNQTLKPNRVLIDESEKPVLLVMNYPIDQSLDKQENKTGRWKASPFVKMDRLLRESNVQLGIVTNGHDFRLVYSAPGFSTSYLSWNSQSWHDEKITLDSFYHLLSKDRLFGKNIKKLLELIEDSQKRQIDVANQLGNQVKDAIEILVKALDKADKLSNRKLFKDVHGDEIYHIVLTVMMRLVFLLYAEENYLLPHGQMIYDKSYGITYLLGKLRYDSKIDDNSLDENYDAYGQILATFRLVHAGSSHSDLPLKGYGGDLFDPKKFSILEDPRLRISNKDIQEILLKLTFTQSKLGKMRAAQRLSYQALDVEQIGSIYENLFDYVVKRSNKQLLVLTGTEGVIIKSSELESISETKLINYLHERTGKSKSKLELLLRTNSDKVSTKEKISELIVEYIESGSLYLSQKKGERKGSGSFYTPKEVTNFLVRKVLDDLVYDKKDDKLIIKPPKAILDLRICDPAMGSGAFLVQTCRYLAERLVESWNVIMSRNPEEIFTYPYAEPTQGKSDEEIISTDHEEIMLFARRLVAERCLYGVDLNSLSVELAKMSLWLTTMAKDKPFSFLDHHLKSGNSLIGCQHELINKYPYDSWERILDKTKFISKIKQQIKLQMKNAGKGQQFLFNIDEDVNDFLDDALSKLNYIEKIPVFDYIEKKKQYKEYLQNSDLKKIKRIFNAWTSLWFWPTDNYNLKKIPLSDYYSSFLNCQKSKINNDLKKYWRNMTEQLAKKHKFFHWELEFPQIFFRSNPGFDAIIGNPPWDKIKFEEPEFLNRYYFGYSKLTPTERERIKNEVFRDKDVSQKFDFEKEFSNDFANYIDKSSKFIHQSANVYGKKKSADKNLYKLFIEQIFNVTRKTGLFGFISPASLATDESNAGLRRLLLEKTAPLGLWLFFKRAQIFPIDIPIGIFVFKNEFNENEFVCIDNLGYKSRKNIPAIISELELRTTRSPKINVELIKKLSEELVIFQIVNDNDQLEILKKLFKFPILRKKINNNWNVLTTTELHAASDKKWFVRIKTEIPLWRGKNIQRYQISKPNEWVNPECPKLKKEDNMHPRLCWALFSAAINVRRLVFTIIPSGGATVNSVCYFKPINDMSLTLYLCGVLNSLVCEYRVRQTVQGINIAQYVIRELPIPRLSYTNPIRKAIVKRIYQLVGNVFNNSIPIFLDKYSHEKNKNKRLQLEAEIEALVAIAYDLDKKMYSNLVQSIILPSGRAKKCEKEKRELAIEKYDSMISLLGGKIS